jgi:hypothetical protein
MKNNFKKLTRDEQLMVNGGAFGQKLVCRFWPKFIDQGGIHDRSETLLPPRYCQFLSIPNGNPCQYGGSSGAILCSGYLGGAAGDYYAANDLSACFC